MDFFLQIVSMAFSAFTSATVLPGSSEAVLAVLISAYPQLWGVLLLTATVANTAGSLLTFAAGRLYPLRHKINRRAADWIGRWGSWTLLLAWVPVLGDALALAAGSFKLPLMPSAAALAVGKGLRYTVLVWAVLQTA
ncbi:MAG: DedA family protein [Neisseria sp.]|nr:DedA family protein [Neisseria sp.]